MKSFILRTVELEETVEFFQRMGLEFVKEQHDKGPEHFACERDGVLFEIYPTTLFQPEGFGFRESKDQGDS